MLRGWGDCSVPFSMAAYPSIPWLLNCRPYVRLTEYDIVEPEMRDIILRKLSTKVVFPVICPR